MCVLWVVFCLAAWSPSARSETETPGRAAFLGLKKSDVVSPKGPKADGKPDAAFSLVLHDVGAGRFVSSIELKAVSGPEGLWTSDLKRPAGAGFLGVAPVKAPGRLLNAAKGKLKIDPAKEPDLLLYAADDGKFEDTERKLSVKVSFADGKAVTMPVETEEKPGDAAPDAAGRSYPVHMSAYLKGISNYDAVNPTRVIKGDDKGDALFILTVDAADKEISGIRIQNVEGAAAVWDTVAGGQNPPIGVALTHDPAKLLNKRDSSVSIPLKGRMDLNLYVADNGTVAKGSARYRVGVSFLDGSVSWTPVSSESEGPPPLETPPSAQPPRVNFLANWMGYVSTDAVGPQPQLRPDSKPDAVFGLDIEVVPKSEITGVEIHSLTDFRRKWATGGLDPGAWGLGVAYQGSPQNLLNGSEGAVRIPIEGREQFYVYAADPGDLTNPANTLRMVVHLGPKAAYQQLVTKPAGSPTPRTPTPEKAAPPRPKGVITCEFKGFIADLCNISTRAGKDGYLDGTFILRLKVEEEKQVAKITALGSDGVLRWSSDPQAPVMFLGVALYPKIYDLINAKGGPLNFTVSGHRTIYLYAADNGLLTDPNSRLNIEVTFSDKSSLSAEVIK